MDGEDKPGFLIEYQVLGNSVKVSAVDPVTLTEVSIIGPATVGEEELARNAVNKLKFVLAKKNQPPPEPPPELPPRRRGKLV